MGWIHEDGDTDLSDHEGYPVAVLADGAEPEPVQVPLADGSGTSPNTSWWLYDGKGRRPLATSVRGGCACGWRSAYAYPIDWEDQEATEGYEFGSGPARDWETDHIARLLDTAIPAELREALDTVARTVRELAGDRPLAALTAIGRLEKITTAQGPAAAAAARRQDVTWEAIGKTLAITKQAAYQRFGKRTG